MKLDNKSMWIITVGVAREALTCADLGIGNATGSPIGEDVMLPTFQLVRLRHVLAPISSA